MTRVLLAAPDFNSDLAHEIELWGHVLLGCVQSQDELDRVLRDAAAIDRSEVELLVVDGVSELLNESMVAEWSAIGVPVLLLSDAPEDHARAAALGISVLGRQQVHDRLPELLLGVMLQQPIPVQARAEAGRGTVVAVWGAPGAPGASTLVLNLAAELAQPVARKRRNQAAGLRVCVVDADCWAPSLAPMWAVQSETPGIAAAARCAEHDAWTKADFLRLAVPTSAGVRLLTGLSALERWPELTARRMEVVIDGLRDWCDVVVVDVGSHLEANSDAFIDPLIPRRSAAARAVLARADMVLGVGAADPISLARCVRVWPEWRAVSAVSPQLVINRLRARALGLAPERQVRELCEQFVGQQPAAVLPDDAKAADQALLRAAALRQVAEGSPLRRAIGELAANIRTQLVAPASELVELVPPVP